MEVERDNSDFLLFSPSSFTSAWASQSDRSGLWGIGGGLLGSSGEQGRKSRRLIIFGLRTTLERIKGEALNWLWGNVQTNAMGLFLLVARAQGTRRKGIWKEVE